MLSCFCLLRRKIRQKFRRSRKESYINVFFLFYFMFNKQFTVFITTRAEDVYIDILAGSSSLHIASDCYYTYIFSYLLCHTHIIVIQLSVCYLLRLPGNEVFMPSVFAFTVDKII